MTTTSKLTAQAQARFKAKAERAIDAPLARAEYEAAQKAMHENRLRLRALRLARDAAIAAQPPAPPAPRKRVRARTATARARS
jgi:hypothetical protein